jgi:hypothetical protein
MDSNNMKNSKAEEQIDLTMQSIKGIHRAKANPFLYQKVMARINNNTEEPETNLNSVWNLKYAFLIIAFIILNIFTIAKFSGENTLSENKTPTTISPKEIFTKEYFESSSNNYGY